MNSFMFSINIFFKCFAWFINRFMLFREFEKSLAAAEAAAAEQFSNFMDPSFAGAVKKKANAKIFKAKESFIKWEVPGLS